MANVSVQKCVNAIQVMTGTQNQRSVSRVAITIVRMESAQRPRLVPATRATSSITRWIYVFPIAKTHARMESALPRIRVRATRATPPKMIHRTFANPFVKFSAIMASVWSRTLASATRTTWCTMKIGLMTAIVASIALK